MNIKYLLDQQFSVQLYKKGEAIYHPDTQPRAVYFIKTGKVKMVTVNNDGQEFIQGIFYKGQSFGEPPLFLSQKYPASAIAVEETELFLLSKPCFMKLLEENPLISIKIIESDKQVILQTLTSNLVDIEDAVHYFTAIFHNMDYIITNDIHFQKAALSVLPVISVGKFINLIDDFS